MKIECPTGTSAFTLVRKLIDFYKNNAPVSIAEVSTYKIRDSTYYYDYFYFDLIL